MDASFENSDKLVCKRRYNNVLSPDKELNHTSVTEGTFDDSIWGCSYLFNEITKMLPVHWISWIETKISGMFSDLSTKLPFRDLDSTPYGPAYHTPSGDTWDGSSNDI